MLVFVYILHNILGSIYAVCTINRLPFIPHHPPISQRTACTRFDPPIYLLGILYNIYAYVYNIYVYMLRSVCTLSINTERAEGPPIKATTDHPLLPPPPTPTHPLVRTRAHNYNHWRPSVRPGYLERCGGGGVFGGDGGGGCGGGDGTPLCCGGCGVMTVAAAVESVDIHQDL